MTLVVVVVVVVVVDVDVSSARRRATSASHSYRTDVPPSRSWSIRRSSRARPIRNPTPNSAKPSGNVIVRSSHLAVGTALLLALLVLLLGHWGVHALTSLDSVRDVAINQLPWVALYVAVSCAAFQLDGIFIGTSESRPMRNSTLIALLLFIGTSIALMTWGNTGLWLAFLLFVIFRGLTLGACLPGLYRRHFGLRNVG